MSESDVKPVKAGQLKVGNYIVYDGEVYTVKTLTSSKAGKHGHAKVRMTIENVFTGGKKSIVTPTDDKYMQPIVEKKAAQVLSVTPDSIQLMDQESYETFETPIPHDEGLENLESGEFVTVWYVIGKRVIRERRADAGSSAQDY